MRLEKKGRPIRLCQWPHLLRLRLGLRRRLLLVRCLLEFLRRLLGLPAGVLDEIRKIVPPHRPPMRKAPKVSREQIVLNMKKRLEKEEQELRERKSALEHARKLVAEKQQKIWIRQQLSVI